MYGVIHGTVYGYVEGLIVRHNLGVSWPKKERCYWRKMLLLLTQFIKLVMCRGAWCYT